VTTGPTVVLGIDTATDVRAGVGREGQVVVTDSVADRRAHAEQLLPLVQRVLAAAGVTPKHLTGIVVGVGPGPFTGLRVGVAAAVTLAEALGIGVRGVCSLDVVALEWAARGDAPATGFAVVADARRKEVYWARYATVGGVATRVDGPYVAAAADVPRHGLPVVGRGAVLYPDALGPAFEPLEPSAAALATIAARALRQGAVGPGVLLTPEPLYLRRPDAVEPGGRKRVLQ